MRNPGRRVGASCDARGRLRICVVGLSCLLLGTACALGGGGRPRDDRIARPEAAASYDVLVGEFALRDGDLALSRDAFTRAAAKDPESAYIHRRLALLAAQFEDLDGAIEYAARAVELDPDNIQERLFLSRLYLARRDVAGAERVLTGPDGLPVSIEAALKLTPLYLEAGRTDKAIASALAAVRFDPDRLAVHAALAGAYERAGRREDAERALRAALLYFPGTPNLYVRIARLARSHADYEAQVAAYREGLAENPGHYRLLMGLGDAQIEHEDIEGALETYRELIAAHRGNLRALGKLAGLEVAAGHPERAASLLTRAVEEHPDLPGLAFVLGQLKADLGESDAALEAFARVPPGDNRYVDARLQMSLIHEEAGEFGQALAAAEPVLRYEPSRPIRFHIAGLRARNGDLVGAVALIEEIRREDPDDAEVLYQLGVVHGLARRIDEAVDYMRASLESGGENAHALNYIGYTWAERGENLDKAEALIVRALELRPEDGYITDSLGWVYYMRARPLMNSDRSSDGMALLEQARSQLIRADELTGGDPVVAEHLGDVHVLMNEKQRALEYYEKAIELEPRLDEQPDLFEKLEKLRSEVGTE